MLQTENSDKVCFTRVKSCDHVLRKFQHFTAKGCFMKGLNTDLTWLEENLDQLFINHFDRLRQVTMTTGCLKKLCLVWASFA